MRRASATTAKRASSAALCQRNLFLLPDSISLYRYRNALAYSAFGFMFFPAIRYVPMTNGMSQRAVAHTTRTPIRSMRIPALTMSVMRIAREP